jgi:hypothetical protein
VDGFTEQMEALCSVRVYMVLELKGTKDGAIVLASKKERRAGVAWSSWFEESR